MRNEKAFSLIEIMISLALFFSILSIFIYFFTSFYSLQKKIDESISIEENHRLFQSILSNTNACTFSLKGKKEKQNILLKTKDGNTESLSQQLTSEKKLKIYLSDFYPDQFEFKRGYVDLIFDYEKKDKSRVQRKTKLWVELDLNDRIETCLDIGDQTQCPKEYSFLTSYDESSFNMHSEQKVSANDLFSGSQMVSQSSNLNSNDQGLSCVSHSICHKGVWKSRAICYNSCTHQFWVDGEIKSKDKKDIETDLKASYMSYLCPEKTFNVSKDCHGKKVKLNLKKSHYKGVQNPKVIIKKDPSKGISPQNTKAYVNSLFECSFAGTWILRKMSCQNPNGTYEWGNPNSTYPDHFHCKTETGRNIPISSYDNKAHMNIDLVKIYGRRKYHIGDPRRVVVLFEDRPSSATLVCDQGGNWRQISTSSKSCVHTNQRIPKLDVLFVMDNSGSMGDEQTRLKNDIDSFTQKFVAGLGQTIDYQILVTTSDYQKRGSTMNQRTANLASQLGSALKAGIHGSYRERMFGSARSMIGSCSNNNPSYNSPFRQDAFLAVIVFSDEPEQSGFNFADYLKCLKKQDKNKLLYSAVIALGNCGSRGQRYHAVDQALKTDPSENNIYDLCSSTYVNSLSQIASKIIERVLVFGR